MAHYAPWVGGRMGPTPQILLQRHSPWKAATIVQEPRPTNPQGFNRHTRTQNFSPKNNEKRLLICSPSSSLLTTANIVDPDPDINATSVSGCCSNQLFISGKSRYF